MTEKYDTMMTAEEEQFWREMNKPIATSPATDTSLTKQLFEDSYTITASHRNYSRPSAPAQKQDAVNPDHYKRGGIECIDGIRAALTPEEFRGYCKGSAMAYLWRDGKKDDPVQEAGKANWYVTWLQGKDPRK
jgi:hypothetical protein